MKKLIILICGLCFLAVTPVYAQNSEIAAATKQLKSYHEALTRGDLAGALAYMTDDFRQETEDLFAENAEFMALTSEIFQKTQFIIKSVELDDDEIIATTEIKMPNVTDVIQQASEKVKPVADEDEYTRQLFAEAIKLLQSDSFNFNTEEIILVMVKENGRWKIDAEL